MTRSEKSAMETSESQHDRFKELARELGCNEDEAAFEASLKKVAKAPPPPKHEPKKRLPKNET
jgi:hypothetical protein